MRRLTATLGLTGLLLGAAAHSDGSLCGLDVDGDGTATALTDGLLVIRHQSGFTGSILAAGAVNSGCSRCSGAEIAAHLATPACKVLFDVDGDGTRTALTDGLLVIRYLFGFSGTALTDGALGRDCTRCTNEAIVAQMEGVGLGGLYQDLDVGLSILYPADFKIVESTSLQDSLLSEQHFRNLEGDFPIVTLSVYENSSDLAVTAWYYATLSDKEFSGYPDSEFREESETSVDGITSLQVDSVIMGTRMIRTFIPHDGTVIGISTQIPDLFSVPPLYYDILSSAVVE